MFDGGGPGFGLFGAFAWLGHLALGVIGAILWLLAVSIVIGVVFLLVRYLLVATKAHQRYLDLNPAVTMASSEPDSGGGANGPASDAAVFEGTLIEEVIVVETPMAPPAPVVQPEPMAPPADTEPPAPKSATSHVSAGSPVPPAPKPATKPRTPRTPRTPKTPPAAG